MNAEAEDEALLLEVERLAGLLSIARSGLLAATAAIPNDRTRERVWRCWESSNPVTLPNGNPLENGE